MTTLKVGAGVTIIGADGVAIPVTDGLIEVPEAQAAACIDAGCERVAAAYIAPATAETAVDTLNTLLTELASQGILAASE